MSAQPKYRFEFDAAEVGTLCQGLRDHLAHGGERAPTKLLLDRIVSELRDQQDDRTFQGTATVGNKEKE